MKLASLRKLTGMAALISAVALSVAGCPAEKPKPEPKHKDVAPAPKKEAKPVKAAPPAGPACVGPMTDAPEASFEVAGVKYERKGSTLNIGLKDDDDQFVIGQITDIKEDNPENAANIDALLKWFKAQKVDAIALTGDIGRTPEGIANVVRKVAATNLPVLTVIGNRECVADYKKGIAAAAADHKNVIDMNDIRVVNADDASFVSLPGYFNRPYLHCDAGCHYTPADVDALPSFAPKATAPATVLISHGPPRMEGVTALDRIHEKANVGDRALAAVLAKTKAFPFGLFGNIQEAGGRGTDLSGKPIAPGTFTDSLYLNSGPADAVRWSMLDGTDSVGMGGVLRIKGKQASYEIHRLKAKAK